MNNIVPLRHIGEHSPNTLNGKVPPRRQPNKAVRSREYLTQDEVDALMAAAGRIGGTDTAIELCF